MTEKGYIGPQLLIRRTQKRFLDQCEGEITDKNFTSVMESYDEAEFGPRFELPMLNYMRNTPLSYKDCLRFRIWFKPPNGGDSRCSEHLSIKGAQEKQIELEGKGYRVEPVIIGVFWDNAVGCFGECQVKELV